MRTDVCIIGAGPGGLACADLLALRDVQVVVVNEGPIMGYGIDGAFTSKAEFEITRQYVYASRQPEIFGEVARPSYERMVSGVRAAAAGLRQNLSDRLARLKSVDYIEGRAAFIDRHTVQVGEQQISAEHFVIATGSRPRMPADLDQSNGRVFNSDSIFKMDECPPSMLIVGAGVIGCEFACIFAALGCEVHLLDTRPQILANEDADVSTFLAKAFDAHGVQVIPDSRYESLEVSDYGVTTRLEGGRSIETAAVLFAMGRQAQTAHLNLDCVGVETDEHGYIATDGTMETNVEHVYAVGDAGRRNTPLDMALVHVAQAEGRCAAHQILQETFNSKMDHVPYIVFTIPMLAGAGLSETLARQRYGDEIRVGKYPHNRNHRAHANLPAIGFTKLIVGPPGNDRILGVRVVGREADTLVAAASIMIERELPYTYLLDSILPHPSLIECLQGAAHIIGGDTLDYESGEEFGLE